MPATLLKMALYASLALCGLGLLWRVAGWFRTRIGPDVRDVGAWRRVGGTLADGLRALFSRRAPGLLLALVWDVLLQGRLFATSKVRWAGHLLLVAGFGVLLVLHALAAVVTAKLFEDYQPTLDPWQLVRNVAGAAVVVGVALMVAGRAWHRPAMRPARRPGDRLFAALLGVVIVTGFLLEAQKLAGPRSFYRMTGEYMMTVDPEELKPLRTHWAREFGTAFDDLPADPDPAVLAEGRQLHEDACAGCHAPARSAFVSYGMARAMGPVAGTLDAGEADKWLLYVHVFACFLGLAALPFTRFFHVLADPVSLLANAAGPAASAPAAARATRRALALDACVQCRACDLRCSVAPIARQLDNPDLLPSHKLRAVASIASGRLARRTDGRAERAAEGAFLCSDCGRCTDACPAGLDLGDLWEATRGDLDAAGLSCAAGWIQARPALAWADDLAARSGMPGLSAGATGPTDPASCPLSDDRHTFEKCVQCQTCTNVCPVVACSLDPRSAVDLTPQKVMNLLRLGLRDLALGSRMVWDCATCYQCQENCPEGVRVTDILLELRNLGYRRLATVRERRRPS